MTTPLVAECDKGETEAKHNEEFDEVALMLVLEANYRLALVWCALSWICF